VFSLWVGVVHGFYANILAKIANLDGIKAVIINQKEASSTSWLLRIDQHNLTQAGYARLISALGEAEKLEAGARALTGTANFYEKADYELQLEFTGEGRIRAHLSSDTGLMLVGRNYYQLSEEAMEMLNQIDSVN
ncbi:hypothetical protein IH575_03715, partial [Candidatus Dojkabacteria bacterium]|nr:hypothetical protein [Candidatus Dojkabacteria bacterium]